MKTVAEMSMELQVIRVPDGRYRRYAAEIFATHGYKPGQVIMAPLGVLGKHNRGPGIYVAESDVRSDEEIRAVFWNLDPTQASA